ncbi:carboxypeptidase-like regulatory domain-containing protein [uncultured Microscilla sp.]|uniref:carboxypeptidase-like regulatory domain-containing protein n=1 Tax=uncultured Microscilla sp. TaxID=432653 RepID=UPI00263A3A47|nr:carboxypeptidase-like regulatory domain-containing protein [uncultured Microscilla sp.]
MKFFYLSTSYLLATFTCVLFLASPAWSQDSVQVKGKVTYQNQGMPQVQVWLKGSKLATTTQANGTYQLSLPTFSRSTLVFSLPGFVTVTQVIGQEHLVNIELQKLPAPTPPQTYTVRTLKPEALTYATDIFKSIQNRVAGAWITSSSGAPGAATQLLLRGHRSINGNNSPLIILDGMPVNNLTLGNSVVGVDQTNRLMDLSPHDIASVEIIPSFSSRLLKYGMLARNGAILLTSKKGKVNTSPRVVFYNRFSVDNVNKLPELQNTYAQGLPVSGRSVHFGPESRLQFAWGPALADLQYNGRPTLYSRQGSLVPLRAGGVAATPNDPYDFFVQGFTFDTHLSVSGGSKNRQYYFAAGRMQQNGFVHTTGFYRNNFSAGIRQKITPHLAIGGKLYLFNTRGQRAYKGNTGASIPRGVMRTPPSFDNSHGNGSSREASRNPSTFTLLANGAPRSFSSFFIENPYGSINRNPYGDVLTGQLAQFDLTWKVSPHWRFTTQVSVDSRSDLRSVGFDIQSSTSLLGAFTEENLEMNNLYFTTELSYRTKLWNKLSVDARVGYFQNRQALINTSAFATPLRVRGDFSLDNGVEVNRFSLPDERSMRNVYLSGSLNYLDGLTLDVGLVNANHSVLNAATLTPTVGLGIDFAPLFFKNSKIVSQLRLNAHYSQISSDADVYTYGQGNLNRTQLLFGLGTTSLDLSTANASYLPALNPEMTSTIEYGASVALFNHRLRAGVSHYQTTTTDQIIALNDVTRGNVLSNGGTINNQGWEFQLGGEVIKNKAVRWYVSANLTRFNSKVSDLPREVARINMGGIDGLRPAYSSASNGQPYGVLYGTYYQRNDQGELIINNQGLPTLGVTGAVGDPTPDWLWGIESNFSWKGVSVGMRWDIRRGGDMWNATQANLDYAGMSQRAAAARTINNYIFPGVKLDGSPNDIPVNFYNLNATQAAEASPFTFYGVTGISEANLQDASWLRLRELTIAYTLPAQWLKNWLISELTLSFIGRNLFLDTRYTGIDPETNLTGTGNGFGVDLYNMPQTKSVGGAVMMKF